MGEGRATPTLPSALERLLPRQGSEPTGEPRSKGSSLHTRHTPQQASGGHWQCGISQHRSGQAFRSEGTALDVRTLRGPSDIQEVKLTGALEEGFEKQVMLGLFGQAYWLGERLGCLQLRPSLTSALRGIASWNDVAIPAPVGLRS